jgi:hypothetical protein
MRRVTLMLVAMAVMVPLAPHAVQSYSEGPGRFSPSSPDQGL